MKRVSAAVAAFFLSACAAFATTVSATITGADGSPYANGSYLIQLVDSGGHLFLNTGVGIVANQTSFTGSLDGAGSFSIILPANSTVAAGSQWQFTVCSSPADGQPVCFSSAQTISGSTQSLSAALSAVAPSLSKDPTSPNQDATKHYVDANAGTGTLSGAVQGSASATTLRDYINVKDYGAVCNGSTDDTTAINNAITAAAGKTLYVPDGTCIHQPLTITTAIKIVLAPNAILQLKAGSTASAISISASNVQIIGGTLDGNSANNPSAQNGIFIGSGLSDILIERVVFLNDAQSNILTLGASGPATSRVIIRHCTFNGAGNHAVYFNWDTTNSEISDNQFLSGSQNAIWVGNSSTGVRIVNNYITGYGRMGIEINLSSPGAVVANNLITNAGSGSTAFGISIDTSANTVVANNSVTLTSPASGNVGIEIVASNDSSVTGNVVINASLGMTINQSSNVSVTGNRIHAFTGAAGILLGSSVAATSASGNVISGNRITVSQASGSAIGIWLQANASGVTVNDNQIIGNVIDGQNTTSGIGVTLELDTGTMSRNQLGSNTFYTLGTAVNHSNDANTGMVLNQYDNIGTKDGGSTANGRPMRFDNYVLSLDDNNNKLVQPGSGTSVLVSSLQVSSTSGPKYTASGNNALIVPGSDSVNGIQLANASGTPILTIDTTHSIPISTEFEVTRDVRSGSASSTDLAGTVTLSSGSGSYTFTGSYASAPICTASDTTAANAVKVAATTTTLTLTGTGSDVLNYVCIGRN